MVRGMLRIVRTVDQYLGSHPEYYDLVAEALAAAVGKPHFDDPKARWHAQLVLPNDDPFLEPNPEEMSEGEGGSEDDDFESGAATKKRTRRSGATKAKKRARKVARGSGKAMHDQ